MRNLRGAFILAGAAMLYSGTSRAQDRPVDDQPKPWKATTNSVGKVTMLTVGGLALVGAGYYGIRTLSENGDVEQHQQACSRGEFGSCWRHEATVGRTRATNTNALMLGMVGGASLLSYTFLTLSGEIGSDSPSWASGRPPGGKKLTLELIYGAASGLTIGSAIFATKMLADYSDTMSELDDCYGGSTEGCTRARAASNDQEAAGLWAVGGATASMVLTMGGTLIERYVWPNDVVRSARVVPMAGAGTTGAELMVEF